MGHAGQRTGDVCVPDPPLNYLQGLEETWGGGGSQNNMEVMCIAHGMSGHNRQLTKIIQLGQGVGTGLVGMAAEDHREFILVNCAMHRKALTRLHVSKKFEHHRSPRKPIPHDLHTRLK